MSIYMCDKLRKHMKLITAYLNGAVIEYYYPGNEKWIEAKYPDWDVETKYRVKPKKITKWISIYPDGYPAFLSDTKEEADHKRSVIRIACIPITYTEGEGL